LKRPGERSVCDWCPNLIPYSPLISSLTFSSLPCPWQIPGEVRTIKKDDQPLDLNMVEILHMKYAVWAEGHMETCVAAIACLAQTINDLIVELVRKWEQRLRQAAKLATHSTMKELQLPPGTSW
jgi:hypothetical protein